MKKQPQLFTLLPLEWRLVGEKHWTVETVFGRISIDFTEMWNWDYCFTEYYDEKQFTGLSSFRSAKAAAEKFYRSRILPALKKVNSTRRKSDVPVSRRTRTTVQSRRGNS